MWELPPRAFVIGAWALALLLGVLAGATDIDAIVGGESGPSSSEVGLRFLLANVFLTHGGILIVIGLGVSLTRIPPTSFGLATPASPEVLIWGVSGGLVLYGLDELLSVLARGVGLVPDERLRTVLAPGTGPGWLVVLAVMFPLVAIAEEVLFRAILIGATGGVLGVGSWPLVIGSSVVFGVTHRSQGWGGVVVTGLLGIGFGALFLATESLLVVFVAHYLVNALELLVHEWEQAPL